MPEGTTVGEVPTLNHEVAYRVRSSKEIRDARIRVAVIGIGECLTDIGNVLAQGGVREDNQHKIGGIAIGLEKAAANMRGEPYGSFDMLQDIAAFHAKFQQLYQGKPRLMPRDMKEFRVKFMREELDEFSVACESDDMEKAFDALIDLAYVLFGTVHLMGLSAVFAEGWRRVQEANMAKELASSVEHSRESTGRGYALDVVKPAGWKPPSHTDLVNAP